MSEDTNRPRTSRFRRSSRFRTPKAPPGPGEKKGAEEGASQEEGAGESPPAEESSPARAVAASPPQAADPAALFTPQTPVAPVAPAKTNILTIDVKEWFQAGVFSESIKFSHWGKYERRVEHGINMIINLLRQYDIKATFFILGIVAREFPEMVRLIAGDGHEIGTCGYYNRRLHSIPPGEYIKEIEMSLSLLKSLTGKEIICHRAPEWSVTQHTLWVMDVLKKFGIRYDSSIYPISGDLCGIEESPRFPYVMNPSGVIEVPPSTYNFFGKNFPLFGGTYFRILPITLVNLAVSSVNGQGHPAVFHISPWEVDGEFPKMDVGFDGYLSNYAGVKGAFHRLSAICGQYVLSGISAFYSENPPADSIHINTLGDRRRENPFEN